jgi:hypothetical protein
MSSRWFCNQFPPEMPSSGHIVPVHDWHTMGQATRQRPEYVSLSVEPVAQRQDSAEQIGTYPSLHQGQHGLAMEQGAHDVLCGVRL